MDNQTDVTDVTRAEMHDTRASITEQLQTLEQQVVDSVQGTATAVEQTAEAVHETVENVKDTFDLRLQVRLHPWAMVGGSIALGYLGGYLLFRHGPAQPKRKAKSQPAVPDTPPITEKQNGVVKERFQEEAAVKKPVQDAGPAAAVPGWLDGVHHWFAEEMNTVKGLAIGAVLGVVRDTITQSAPERLKAGLTDVIDGITVKMGGEPIHGPVLKNEKSH